jgi:cytochrome c oxidase subunit 3
MPDSTIADQFESSAQQREAVGLGMWTFLTTEVLFFGGLFTAYTVYRMQYPAAFAEASQRLYQWLGALNTAVLLTSSWTMVLAVDAASRGDARRARTFLLRTTGLALIFLIVKCVEYSLDAHERLIPGERFTTQWSADRSHVQLYFVLYFAMTGLHALHMVAGVGVMLVLTALVRVRGAARCANAVDMAGLYWHFVDIVWVFLFPLLYLMAPP